VTSPSPAAEAARSARNGVETVLFTLREIPLEFDREGVAQRLQRALHCLYTTIDTDVLSPAHYEGVAEAARVLAEGRSLLAGAGDPGRTPALRRALLITDNAIRQAATAAEQIAQVQLDERFRLRRAVPEDPVPKPRPFRASIGKPQLHAIARPPLTPRISVDPIVPLPDKTPPSPAVNIPKPKTLDELRAFGEASRSGELPAGLRDEEPVPVYEAPIEVPELAYRPAIEEREVLRIMARDALEDIANLSTLRKPIPTETWLDQAPFEQRLLNNLDYLVSLGGIALPLIPIFHAESESPDPARAFAVAFTLGCIAGTDTVDVAIAALKQSPPEERSGFVEGWWLAPNPAIDEALGDVLGHPKAAIAAVALETLAARGSLSADAVPWVETRGDPGLTRILAGALGTNLPSTKAIRVLEAMIERAGEDDALFLASTESLLRRGHARARELTRLALNSSSSARVGRAAWLLCVSAGADDADLLVGTAKAQPSQLLARGLGRFGHVDAVPVLVELLTHEDEGLGEAAADALDCIAGPVLRETVEEPWDLGAPPEALAVEGAPPPPTRKVQKVIRDPRRWQEWYSRIGSKLDRKKRWRAGVPFSLAQIVDELEAKDGTPERREAATLELAIATGIDHRFSPRDWVARQHERIAEAREAVRGLAIAPGSWCFAVGRLTASAQSSGAASSSFPPPPPIRREAAVGAEPSEHTPAEQRGVKLGLISYASACAEVAVHPGRADAAWAKYGLAGTAIEAEHTAWRTQFRTFPEERAEFERHLEQFKGHWRTQKT